MSLFLIVSGVACLIYGTLTVFGFTNDDITKDSDLDKKLFSEKSRYFLGRYFSGIKLMAAGAGAIVLGLILYFRP
jgi:hypothetical protein